MLRFFRRRKPVTRASANPGPAERARLHALMIERTREMRFELGMPWRI